MDGRVDSMPLNAAPLNSPLTVRPNATGESGTLGEGSEDGGRQLGPPHEELHEPQPDEAPHEEDADVLRPGRRVRTARPRSDRGSVQEETLDKGEPFVRSPPEHQGFQ